MMNSAEGSRRSSDEPRLDRGAYSRLQDDCSRNAIEVELQDARTLDATANALTSLGRLARLAPDVASELFALWKDLDQLGRLVEELLGNGKEPTLDDRAILELVRLYEFLEDIRTVGTTDGVAKVCSAYSPTNCRRQLSLG